MNTIVEVQNYNNVEINNIVVNGTLSNEIDLEEVSTISKEDWSINFNKGVPITVEFNYKDLPMVSVYSSGSYIIRGVNKELLKESTEKFISLMYDLGIIDGLEDVNFDINNIVGTITLDNKLDLDSISNLGDSSKYQYEPESFPAVTYRGSDFYTCNIFHSGKIILQGCNSEEQIVEA